MRSLIALLAVAVVLVVPPLYAAEDEGAPAERVARVLIRSGDAFHGAGLELTPELVRVETPYSGTVDIDRRAVAGITFTTGRDAQVLDRGKRERDTLQMLTGDTISGEIIRSDDGTLLVKTFYAGGKETSIALDKVEYIIFATPGDEDALELKPDPVRVIFANGDVVSGTLAGFKSDAFRLETQYAGAVRFTTDDIQSLHNVAKSRQLFPGGLAEAFMRLFESSSEMRRQYMNILPTLVRGFLAQGDVDGALYIFNRMARYELDWYDLARAFEAAKLPDAALECYERMYNRRRNNPYVYRQLYQAYKRHGRYAKAAEVYEELLKQATSTLPSAGIQEGEVRMALAEMYAKLEEHEKAIGHLRKVLDDASTNPATRHQARAALVDSFNKIGQLDELIGRYTTEAATLDTQLGQDYLALVEHYIERGKLTKARMQHERLAELGLNEYAARAKALLDEAENAQPEDETEDEE